MRPQHHSLVAAFFCFLVVLSVTNIAQGRSKDPIRIGFEEQTRQKVAAHIVAYALQKAGFKFEFVKFEGPQLEMIASGEAHVNLTFSIAETPGQLEHAIADKKIIALGGLKGNGADEPELKIIWAGMRHKWPYAERMLKTIIIPTEDIESLTKVVDDGDMMIDQAVDGWMKQNTGKWKRWISASKNWMKP